MIIQGNKIILRTFEIERMFFYKDKLIIVLRQSNGVNRESNKSNNVPIEKIPD